MSLRPANCAENSFDESRVAAKNERRLQKIDDQLPLFQLVVVRLFKYLTKTFSSYPRRLNLSQNSVLDRDDEILDCLIQNFLDEVKKTPQKTNSQTEIWSRNFLGRLGALQEFFCSLGLSRSQKTITDVRQWDLSCCWLQREITFCAPLKKTVRTAHTP